jgi:hypothetical protein
MILELYTQIVLNRDIPTENLKPGSLAMFIDVLVHPDGGEDGALLEVFNVLGDFIAVITVPMSAIEPLQADYILSVRPIETAHHPGR